MGAKDFLAELAQAGVRTVTVPRALLALCSDLLAECDKHMPITGTNFDEDMDLAREQLRLHL